MWIPVDGPWRFKDEEMLDERVREGRYTAEQVAAIRALGETIGAMLDRGERWWDESWASFEPDPAWRAPAFPEGWEDVPRRPSRPRPRRARRAAAPCSCRREAWADISPLRPDVSD